MQIRRWGRQASAGLHDLIPILFITRCNTTSVFTRLSYRRDGIGYMSLISRRLVSAGHAGEKLLFIEQGEINKGGVEVSILGVQLPGEMLCKDARNQFPT
jgi:hypothetical protein